jgi:sigma-B regulation protein RsbU (phosphoserine phosphatase)
MSVLVLTLVVVAGISAVAYADKSVASVSLAPLYFLPLALSALVHPLRISLALSIVCLVLHDLVGPMRDLGTRHLARNVTTLLGYVFVVAVVNQLGGQRRRLAEFAERQRDELANEIALAAEVQQGILPRSIPRVPGFDLAARMYPAKTVAGDYYGFILLPAGEIAVVIADVSGKGVAAGLLMPSIEVALRMNAPLFPSTSDLLQLFNNVVCQVTSGLRFISLFYGKLCPQSGSLEYTNAGHNPPLLIRAGTDPSPQTRYGQGADADEPSQSSAQHCAGSGTCRGALWSFRTLFNGKILRPHIFGKQNGNVRVPEARRFQRIHAAFDASLSRVDAEYCCIFAHS